MNSKLKNKLTNITSKYKGVSYYFNHQEKIHFWRLTIGHQGRVARKDFPYSEGGERRAAILYDKKRIEFGKKPVNILVSKC